MFLFNTESFSFGVCRLFSLVFQTLSLGMRSLLCFKSQALCMLSLFLFDSNTFGLGMGSFFSFFPKTFGFNMSSLLSLES